MRTFLSVFVACLTVFAARAGAQDLCRFYLANQSDSVEGLGLSPDAQPDATGTCALSAVNINLAVGDGTGFHHVSVAEPWQTGVAYTVEAVVTAAGPQQLSLNGVTSEARRACSNPLRI